MAENEKKRLKTKEKLKSALIELCGEKGFYDVMIGEICGRAGLYRSTFYRYYETKDEMLREIEREYLDAARDLTPTLWNYHRDAPPKLLEQCRSELIADLEYHWNHRQICKFLLSPAGDDELGLIHPDVIGADIPVGGVQGAVHHHHLRVVHRNPETEPGHKQVHDHFGHSARPDAPASAKTPPGHPRGSDPD